MAGSKYTILVNANLNQTESLALINDSLKTLSKQVVLEITQVDLNLSQAAITKLQDDIKKAIGTINVNVGANVTNNVGGGGPNPNPTPNPTNPNPSIPPVGSGILNSLFSGQAINTNEEIQRIRASLGDYYKDISILTDAQGLATRATLKYKDASGLLIQELYTLDKKTGEVTVETTKYSDNAEKKVVALTQSQKTLQSAYEKMLSTRKKAEEAENDKSFDKTKIDSAKVAILEYEQVIDRLNNKLKSGSPISSKDKLDLANKETAITRINNELDEEKNRLVAILKQNELINSELEKARALSTRTTVKTTGNEEYTNLPEVQNLIAANEQYKISIDKVKIAQETGSATLQQETVELEKNRLAVIEATQALDIREKYSESELQRINKTTQGIKALESSAEKLIATNRKIDELKDVKTPGIADPNLIRQAETAATNYEKTITDIAAKGNIISAEDNHRIVQAQIELKKINDLLDQEKSRVSAVVTENEKITDELEKARTLVTKTTVRTTGNEEYTNLPEVQALIAANDQYKASIQRVSIAQETGSATLQQETVELEKNRLAVIEATQALDIREKQEAVLAQAEKERLRVEKDIDDQVKRANAVIANNEAAMKNKSAGSKEYKAVVAANEELKASVDQVTDARKAGIPVAQKDLDLLEKNRIAARTAGENLRAFGKDANSWTHEIDIAIKRVAEWAIATTAIYGSLRQIKEGIQYVKDLNKELTNIQIVSGQDAAQVGALAEQYNKLAKELGSTTIEVARGSLEWVNYIAHYKFF